MAQFTKPLAVVTGASSGIGFELARQFAQNGFDLLIAAEDSGIEDAAFKLEAEGAFVQTVQTDLSTYDGVEELYNVIEACGVPVDAIAINAGVGVGGPFLKTDLEKELGMIDLNVVSVVHLTKRVVRDMVARNKGRILFTASVVSVNPAPYQTVYGATKAFVLSFAEALREELKDTDVSITALMPGATDTNFFDRAGGLEDTKVGQSKKDDPADVARDGFEALMAGKDSVVAHSIMSKVNGLMGEVLPETVKARMMGKMSEPGSASK